MPQTLSASPPPPTTGAELAADGSGRLTHYYILALSAVALLSLAGQALVQAQLFDQLNDSKLVNVAGRQRMLSQRIVKCALVLGGPASSTERAARIDELHSSLTSWRRSHAELQHEDSSAGIAAGNSPETAADFIKLAPAFQAMSDAAQRIASASTPPQAADLALLLEHEPAFLEGMDAIVARYEREVQAKVSRLRVLECVLLCLTLGTLLLEGLYVFRPAARQIRQSFAALTELGGELRAARDLAESANRAKSQFLANVSHELRTPLHSILGGVEMADRGNLHPDEGGEPNGRTTEALALIGDSARRQLSLVNDLLDLSKIEAGKLALADAPFDLHDLLARNAAMMRPLADAQGLQFRVDLAADLPRYVTGDALRVGQVLTNLLGNACKFTEEGEILLRAYVCRRDGEEREIRFVVRDTGIGIPADLQRSIFDSFTQVDAAGDRAREGAGLGLSVSKQLAELMQGRLEVESRLGEGSTFVFAWPCREAPTPAQSDASGADATLTMDDAGASLRVLAVDDTSPGRRVLESMLVDLGHRPTCVADGRAAIAAFAADRFDVVLLDLHMPNLDGRTTAASIRSQEAAVGSPRTPILLVTADATAETEVPTATGDFDGFLLKPFTWDELRRALMPYATGNERADLQQPAQADSPSARALARLNNNAHLLNDLVEMFLSETPAVLAQMQCCIDKQDLVNLWQHAHLLHGQLLMLELEAGAVLVGNLEIQAESHDFSSARDTFSTLCNIWPKLAECAQSLTSSTIQGSPK